jgi:streptogramin lyase
MGALASRFWITTEDRSMLAQIRLRHLTLAFVILLGAAVGVAKQALAQKFTEFPIPTANSLPLGITTGPDGALWFTENNFNKIGRITTAGGIFEITIPTANSLPIGITAGPDGALWFTEFQANKIGRITTEGVITESTIPTAGGDPRGITAGPDGALWFTENSGNKIGRITTGAGRRAVVHREPRQQDRADHDRGRLHQ